MLSDAVLVERVVAGFDEAFDELYRRHAPAAWRLGQAVAGNGHDAADAVAEAFARVLQAVRAGRLADGSAFRPYLLAATRNAALDGLRRRSRTHPDDELDAVAATAPTPADAASHTADAALVAEAFRNLPERWRSVLWLTEVEGVPTKDAADQLGLSPNGTAQLAVRARAGLRERYLQAHLKGDVRPACRFTVEHLGAYVGGAISPRDLAKVDQHLAGCATCTARREELEDLGTPLRHLALPIPLALGAISAERVHAVLTASSSSLPTGSLAARAIQLAKEPTPFMRKAAGASAAGVLALGLLALPFASSDKGVKGLAAPDGTVQSAAAPAVAEVPAASFDTAGGSYALPAGIGGTTSVDRRAFTAPRGTAVTPPASTKSTTTTTAPAPTPAATKPDAPANPLTQLLGPILTPILPSPGAAPTEIPANVGINLGGHDLGLGAIVGTTPALGVEADDTVVGTTDPATPTTPGIVVQVGPLTVPVPLPLP
jgi:RNA polymerase sigma factor (sigma-70 family)